MTFATDSSSTATSTTNTTTTTTLSSNMASNTKNYKNTNNKKVLEVQEVIQNKPEAEIVKVLEHFDNDVGKTIDAFINDGGKEALAKWSEAKSKKQQKKKANEKQATVDEQSQAETEAGASATDPTSVSPRNRSTKKTNGNPKQQQQSQQQPTKRINDLVSSIISQYTSTKSESTAASPAPTPLVAGESLFDNLNNLINSSQSSALSKTVSGLKVTVLGIEQSAPAPVKTVNVSPVLSSVSSSPSSMSVVSVVSSTDKQERPHLLELSHQPSNGARRFNTSLNNPNSKTILEKSHKDLQRQTAVLSKISTTFHEELNKSQNLFNQTFTQLRQLLNERQSQLQAKLNFVAQNANHMLVQRQHKAAELRVLADNSIHLNDQEALELKADIKHFVSERQLDEDFAKVKVFQEENFEKLVEAIDSFGHIAQMSNKYATQRPPLNELFSVTSPTSPTPPLSQAANSKPAANGARKGPELTNGNSKPVTTVPASNQNSLKMKNGAPTSGPAAAKMTNGTNYVKSDSKVNGDTNGDADEGEFIEVKKPQRNKNKQPTANGVNGNGAVNHSANNGTAATTTKPYSQQNGGAVQARPQPVNGNAAPLNGNGVNMVKKPQRTTPLNGRPIANGH